VQVRGDEEKKTSAVILQKWFLGVRRGREKGGDVGVISTHAILKRRRASRRAGIADSDARSDRGRLIDLEKKLDELMELVKGHVVTPTTS